MTSDSAGQITLTPTVVSGRPHRGSNTRPPHRSHALYGMSWGRPPMLRNYTKVYFCAMLCLFTSLLLLWRILNGRGLPNCLTELPSLECLSSSLHSRDSHPFANVLRPSPSGSPSASPTLTYALQE